MAIYGAPSAGVALTASTANDTVALYGPITSTPVLSASTILGLDGDDFIDLATQGYTATAIATFGASGTFASGIPSGSNLSARLIGQNGAFYTASTGMPTSGTNAGVATAVGVVTSYASLRKAVSSQIYGNAGNDTIALGGEVSSASATTIGGGAGNDVIGTYTNVNGQFATGTVTGGAGYQNIFVEGGGGNDVIYFGGASVDFTNSTIQGGQGNDNIGLALTNNSELSNAAILAGGGDDVFSGNGAGLQLRTALQTTIAGGGGNDSMVVNFAVTAASNVILGDALNAASQYDGNDTINLGFTTNFSANTVQGGFGNDLLRLSGANGGGNNVYQLQAGNDILSAEIGRLTADTVQMGAGRDSIFIGTGARMSGGTLIHMGGDNDFFSYSADITGGEAASVATVYGGLGADTFTSNGFGSGTVGFTFGYESVQDSVLSAFDTIQIGNAAASGTYVLHTTFAGNSLATTAAAGFTATNGVAVFTGTFDGSVTARVQALDAAITTEGAGTIFWDGSNVTYFFLKGSSDDLVVQVGSASQGTGTISIAGGKTFTINNN